MIFRSHRTFYWLMGRASFILAFVFATLSVGSSALADGGGSVSNDGQTVVVALTSPIPIGYYGEAAYWAIGAADFALNGEDLRSADFVCTDRYSSGLDISCGAFELRLGDPLLESGTAYVLTMRGREIGSFVAVLPPASPTPRVVSATATSRSITVRFSRPMLSQVECGIESNLSGRSGVIQWVHGPDEPTLFGMGHGGYRGGDEQLDWALLLAVWGTTSDDCSSVTIRSAFGFPPGDHDFMVVGIRSADGLATLPETWLTVHIPSDVPSLLNANISLNTHDVQRVRLIFDLPLDPDSVVKQTSYRLNGRPLPAGTGIACEVITCAWVTLEIPGEAFGYFSQNVIEVEGLRSLAGDSMPHQVSAPFTSYRD